MKLVRFVTYLFLLLEGPNTFEGVSVFGESCFLQAVVIQDRFPLFLDCELPEMAFFRLHGFFVVLGDGDHPFCLGADGPELGALELFFVPRHGVWCWQEVGDGFEVGCGGYLFS